MFRSRFFSAYFFDASFWGKPNASVLPRELSATFVIVSRFTANADISQRLTAIADSSIRLTASADATSL